MSNVVNLTDKREEKQFIADLDNPSLESIKEDLKTLSDLRIMLYRRFLGFPESSPNILSFNHFRSCLDVLMVRVLKYLELHQTGGLDVALELQDILAKNIGYILAMNKLEIDYPIEMIFDLDYNKDRHIAISSKIAKVKIDDGSKEFDRLLLESERYI